MRKTILIMSVVVVLLAFLALFQGGPQMLFSGITAGGLMFRDVIWMIVAAFALSGLAQVLINQDQVKRLLGSESGWRGLILGAVAGGIVPGGPYVYYPIASSFYTAGADTGTIMAFIVAKCLWDLPRLPMEVAIIGARITAIRFLITAIFPILAGLATHRFYPTLIRQGPEYESEGKPIDIPGS
jgi:uncharacterized membrane protein YraQ (UPF0718 family)